MNEIENSMVAYEPDVAEIQRRNLEREAQAEADYNPEEDDKWITECNCF